MNFIEYILTMLHVQLCLILFIIVRIIIVFSVLIKHTYLNRINLINIMYLYALCTFLLVTIIIVEWHRYKLQTNITNWIGFQIFRR